MMVHVTENFYIPDTSGVGENMIRIADDSNRFWIAFWNGGIARICVALFMIVSAFLLVPMKEGVGMAQFYKKRFLRIFPPMLFFMVLYSILPAIWGDFSWEQSWKFLKGSYQSGVTFGSWKECCSITIDKDKKMITCNDGYNIAKRNLVMRKEDEKMFFYKVDEGYVECGVNVIYLSLNDKQEA
jgi:hypothetical protein